MPNQGQEYLLECYEHLLHCLPKRFDILIINGDVIQGTQEPENIWEPKPVFQARAAAKLLKPLAKRARKVYLTAGTEWHSGKGAEAEEEVGERLHAVKEGSNYCFPWLHLNVAGVRLDVAHHQSIMTRYRTSSLEREIQFAALIRDWKGEGDLIIRSHAHHFLCMNIEGCMGLALPGWQLQNIFLKTSTMPSRKFPKWLGAVRIDLYPENKHEAPQDAGEFIKITPLLYSHPSLSEEVVFQK